MHHPDHLGSRIDVSGLRIVYFPLANDYSVFTLGLTK